MNIEHARPTAKDILSHLSEFEDFCMGKVRFSPEKFRNINEELSVGAVLMLGKRRFQNNGNRKHLLWQGLDNREYDLGPVHEPRIMRDYPGFHAACSRSLGSNLVAETEIINGPNGRGNISVVTLIDGTVGIGPNYRTALRNAALKMHLKSKFNFLAMADSVWKSIWGNA